MIDRKTAEFDPVRFRELKNPTVADLIEILKEYADRKLVVDGDNYSYVHVSSDGKYVDIDSSSLEDLYDEEEGNNNQT